MWFAIKIFEDYWTVNNFSRLRKIESEKSVARHAEVKNSFVAKEFVVGRTRFRIEGMRGEVWLLVEAWGDHKERHKLRKKVFTFFEFLSLLGIIRARSHIS